MANAVRTAIPEIANDNDELPGVVDAVFDDETPSGEVVAASVAQAEPSAIGAETTVEPVATPKRRERIEVPRPLTAEIRKRVGIPPAVVPPYRWTYVAFLLCIAGGPMLLLGWYRTTFALAFVALGVVPAIRWWEKREIELRDRVYTHGREVVARVLDVEPGGPDRNGKVVRVEMIVDKNRVEASIFGCPLARRGLEPGDDVVVYYAEDDPRRCLIVERIARAKSPKARRRPEPKGCGAGACGKAGCGAGACGAGGCGAGGGCC